MITLTMQMELIKVVVVAKVKVKAEKVEQLEQTAKREKESKGLKQKVVQGSKTAKKQRE